MNDTKSIDCSSATANASANAIPHAKDNATPRIDMNRQAIIPRAGHVLRRAITSAGLRGHFVELGLDKDVDDLAIEARPGVCADLMQKVEATCWKALAADYGEDWAQFSQWAWALTRQSVQALSQQIDITGSPDEVGHCIILTQFTVPMLVGFLGRCFSDRQGPDPKKWCAYPFQAWVRFAASITEINENDLIASLANAVGVDDRTIQRWCSGEPIGKLAFPYRATLCAAIAVQRREISEHKIDLLSGWLILSVAFQSIERGFLEAIRREFEAGTSASWTLDGAITRIQRDICSATDTFVTDAIVSQLDEAATPFAAKSDTDETRQNRIKALQALVLEPSSSMPYQYLHDWLTARLNALLGRQQDALDGYASAVTGCWWVGGRIQHPLLHEALLYAVGVGDKVASEHYWDKTFMLGLNRWPKHALDDQEIRRISFGFERMFSPQKAKSRIPPQFEIAYRGNAFDVDSKRLSSPNRKVKYSEGRTRRTPLMDAICEGTLDDVKRLIEAGGDPDDFIPESGEGPLTYAMRKAYDQKNSDIMTFLLDLNLKPETVNRPASTARITPLKFAIQMADAQTVARLIELGADLERPCGHLPSALCYSMALFYDSVNDGNPAQMGGYLMGRTKADGYDARDGAILDVELPTRRHALGRFINASDRNRLLFDVVRKYFTRAPEDHRSVVSALMTGGADANRRYKAKPSDMVEWTPTLFAAETGDLPVFKMLVEHNGPNRGNPDLTLMSPSSFERFDAMWVAVKHQRQAIVAYLIQYRPIHT